MVDVNITAQEANWKGEAGRGTDGQDHVLNQADALTKSVVVGGYPNPTQCS